MFARRRNRLLIVLVTLISLLSMQCALASFICPGAVAPMTMVGQAGYSAMPCEQSMADQGDVQPSGLCRAHCQTEHQSTDKYQVPLAMERQPAGTGFIMLASVPVPAGAPVQAPLLTRTTAPPLAVRHCCFRI